MLLQHNSDIEARNENNETPLHNTGLCNSADVTKLLLAHNADIKAKDKDNRTTLHIAALYNSTEVAQLLLLEHHVDIEAREKDNRTILEVARNSCNIWGNTKSVMRLLMEHADFKH